MSKKLGIMLLTAIMFCSNAAPTAAATIVYDGKTYEYNLPPISLYVNGNKIETTMDPIQLDGRVLVPAREVFAPMGAKVDWDANAKKVTVKYKDITMILTVNQKEVWLNGQTVILDVPAKIINDKVMIPVRFISEQLGFKVDWNGSNRWVAITEKLEDEEPPIQEQPPVEDTPSQEEKPSLSNGNYIGTTNKHQIQLPAASHDQTKVMSVTVNEASGQHKTIIKAASPISNAKVEFQAGKVIIDILNSKSQLSNTISPGTNTYIKNIRTSQFTTDTTRVVLDLKAGALVSASFSADRTSIIVTLTNQKIEGVKYTQKNKEDTLFFKGLSKDQINIDYSERENLISLSIPHTTIETAINWAQLNACYISKVTLSNEGDSVRGNIWLKEKANYDLTSDYQGATLTLSAYTEPPLEEEEPEQESTEHLVYVAGDKPTIQLLNLSGLNKNAIKVTDDYRNKTLIFDLGKDYSNVLGSKSMTINDSYINSIQVATNGTTKITVTTKKIYAYNFYESNGKISLQMVKPSEKYTQIVVLDPGHGGSDSGAVGNGITEKAINYNQAMALYKLLEADPQIKVYMTRETDVYPTLQFRTALANEIEADLFISIHNNSASASIRGAETLYYPSDTDTRGKQVAQIVQNALVNKCGMINRGIKARSDLYVLRTSSMPAILIETGFISNAEEALLLSSPTFNSKWANAIYESIIESFKIL